MTEDVPLRYPRVTLAQLRVLQAVARTGSMTRAAEELDTSQPAVSHSVRSLERELETSLLIRHRDGVALSAMGRIVSERAALILNQMEKLRQDVVEARGETYERLRIGVIPSVNARLMPRVLRMFVAAHVDAHVSVLEGSDFEVLEWVRTGAVDVATVTAPAGDLTTTPVASDRMFAVLPATHPLAGGPGVSPADLAREPFIMSTGGCEPLILDIARRAGVSLRSHYHVREAQSILAMVAEGLGVTIMPELALPVTLTGVCAIPVEPAYRRTIFLALPGDARPSTSALAFAEMARHAVAAPELAESEAAPPVTAP